jgi:hypothetical protein
MDWKLELIVVPVSDVDRAKTFYIEQAGFDLNVDHSRRRLIAWAAGASETTGVKVAAWAAVASLIVFRAAGGIACGSTPREFALEGGVGVVMGLAIFALKSLAH